MKIRGRQLLTSPQKSIQYHLSPSSPLCILALRFLMESVAWLTGFINYIDENFTQFNGGKFGINKLWHVTTKTATNFIRDVNQPRMGVMIS